MRSADCQHDTYVTRSRSCEACTTDERRLNAYERTAITAPFARALEASENEGGPLVAFADVYYSFPN